MANKTVIFQATPKQLEFVKAVMSHKYRYLLYGGGVGGGKTFAGLGTMLTLLAAYPGSKGLVIRDTYGNLSNTSIPSWRKLIQDKIGQGYFVTKYNSTDGIFYMRNGSQLQFLAEDYQGKRDMSHLFGLEINFCLLEEAGDLQQQTFLKLIERTGRHLPLNGKIPPPIIMLTCNPTNNWVRQTFYDPWVNSTLPADHFYLPALLQDNPHLAANTAYVESTKANMPAYLYRKFFLGDWDIEEPAEGRIYRCFNPDVHIAEVEYNPELPLHISFDENVNPYLSLTVWQIATERDAEGNIVRRHINLIREILGRYPYNTIQAVCQQFSSYYFNHRAGVLIYGDATSRKSDTKLETGHNLYSLIEGYLVHFKPRNMVMKANPSVVIRTQFADAIFEKEVSNLRIRLNSKCNKTINDFLKTKTDADGTKLKNMVTDPKTKARYQEHGHLTDTFDYFLCSAFANEFELFQTGGRKSGITWGRTKPKTKNRY